MFEKLFKAFIRSDKQKQSLTDYSIFLSQQNHKSQLKHLKNINGYI